MAKLVDAETLLVVVFDKRCRPTLRALRTWQAKRLIPWKKIGRRVYFDPDEVRRALDQRLTIRAKGS